MQTLSLATQRTKAFLVWREAAMQAQGSYCVSGKETLAGACACKEGECQSPPDLSMLCRMVAQRTTELSHLQEDVELWLQEKAANAKSSNGQKLVAVTDKP
eukprot:4550356-Pleurochrysis_carterae.AAC.1